MDVVDDLDAASRAVLSHGRQASGAGQREG